MLKKYLWLMLIVLLINVTCGAGAFAATGAANKEKRFADKVRINIAKLGTGIDAQIQVKLKNGTKLKGYVSEVNNDYFVVTNAKTNAATAVASSNAKQVKGNNLSTGVKIAIGVGVAVAVVAVLVVLFYAGVLSGR